MRSRWALVAFLFAASGVGASHSQPPQTQSPVFRSGVELVTIEATVLNRGGDPVVTLGPDDFTVRIDGRTRKVVWQRLVRADEGRSDAAILTGGAGASVDPILPPAGYAAGTARLFAFVVDRETIPYGEGQQMLEAATLFIDGLLPADRVAVWVLPSPSTRVEFTADREAAKRALRLAVGTYRPPIFGNESKADETKREGVIAADWRQRAEVTLKNLEVLVGALSSIDHPKQLVLITGGPVAAADDTAAIAGLGARAAAARATIHALQVRLTPYQARANRLDPSAPSQKLLDQVPETPDSLDQNQSAAVMLAGMTGGLAITPISASVGFDQLRRELSASYILAVEVELADRDGLAHRIDVTVRDPGWGAKVRARQSFRLERPSRTSADTGAVPPQPADIGGRPASDTAPGAAGLAPAPSSAGTDVEQLKSRLASYVEQFEREFAAVVAEEKCVQIVYPWRGNPKGPEQEPGLEWRDGSEVPKKKGGPIIARRQLLSDVLLVQISGRQWIAYRDVAVVDGASVRDRTERVRELFLSNASDSESQFRRIGAESARYNLGDFRRTLNLPTVTLSFMRRAYQERFTFTRAADEKVAGRVSRVLRFKERTRPTLVATANGVDIPVEGRIWMDAEDGRVVRTEIRFDRGLDLVERRARANLTTGATDYVTESVQNGEQRSSIQVEFRSLPDLGILVPVQMWEWHEGVNQPGRMPTDKSALQSLSAYSNFRRFQVSTTEQIKQ